MSLLVKKSLQSLKSLLVKKSLTIMPEIQITETAIIVIAICATIICGLLLYRMKNGLKVKVGQSGVELDLSETKPENKEIENETINQDIA